MLEVTTRKETVKCLNAVEVIYLTIKWKKGKQVCFIDTGFEHKKSLNLSFMMMKSIPVLLVAISSPHALETHAAWLKLGPGY